MSLDPVESLLEREPELEVMERLLSDIGSSGGKVVLVRGEAGVGKSTLVRAFLDRAAADARVMVGACDDLLTARPLGPFQDMARDDAAFSDALGSRTPTEVMDAVLEIMSRQLQPTVVLIEDVHWADEATLDVIRVVGRRIDNTNGLLLLTYRDGEVDDEHPLRGVMGALPGGSVTRIQLAGLSLDAVARLVADSAVDPQQVFSITGGNPFLAIEMASGDGASVPASVQDSVLARVRKVSPESQELLRLLSVIPERITGSEANRFAGAADDLLVECERSGLLDARGGLLGFRHELIRRAVEASLTNSERERANQRVLERLPDGTDPARIAHHAREAGDVGLLIQYAPVAAQAARDAHSHFEAVSHYRSLEPHLDGIEPADRARVLEEWARSEYLLERHNEAIERITQAWEVYRTVGNTAAQGHCALFAVRLNELAKRSDEADRCLREAMEVLEPLGRTKELAFAVSQQAWLSMMRGDRRASVYAERAIELAEETGDDAAMINALNTKGIARFWEGDPASGVAAFDEAARRARETGDAAEEVRALHNLAHSALFRLDLRYARQTADRTCEAAARFRLPNLERTAQSDLARILLSEGDWDAAERVAEETLDVIPKQALFSARECFLYLGIIQSRRGHPEGGEYLERSWSLMGPSGELLHMAEDAAAQTERMWMTGEIAPDRTARFSEILDELVDFDENTAVSELAFWMWSIGELTEIPDGVAEPYRLIMLGEAAAAAQRWDELGFPYQRAIALCHGDTEERLEALRLLEDLGADAVASKLHQTLRDEGVPVPRLRRRTRSAAGLTPRQTEVLALLAEDLTNVEIADRLFLSRRTVEHHVAAVMAKLAAKTRGDAVSAAREHGLLATD